MIHYSIDITYRKSTLSVIVEKKELTSFIAKYSKGAKQIVIKEVEHFEED